MYERMKVAELRAIAKERGIDLGGATKKAEIIAMLEDAPITVDAEVVDDGDGLSVTFSPAHLSANFDSLERRVSGILAEYDDWEPNPQDDDDIKNAKRHRAYLNGLAREIDERRKAVKREYMQPFDAFESRANAIRDAIKDVSNRLDSAVKDSEEAFKEYRYETLSTAYEAYAGLLAPVVPYSIIHEPKWCNRTMLEAKAVDAMQAKVDSIARSWETLKALNVENQDEAEARFFQTLSLDDAVQFAKEQREQRERVAELKAEIEAISCPVTEEEVYDAPEPKEAPYTPAREPVKPLDDVAQPAVMVIDAITVSQMHEVGRVLGGMGISGVFKRGTLADVLRREAVNA